jgi:diguanylate cyclase (GGDEF)-like protein
MVIRGWFAVTDLPITDYFLAPNIHKFSFLVVSITMLMTTFSIVWMLMARVIAQSYTSSITDELTGLYNRKGLRELYPNLSQHKTSYPIGIILADLDHFKRVNDTFGHEMGDNTLKHFSMLLMQQSRHEDLCIRYGGEEFLLVIPGVNLQTAVEIANRIRRCAQQDSNQDLYTCSYTASLGVSVLADGESLSDAINRADNALYRAKGIGRNRVVCDSRSTFCEAILR